ncbi:MAG: glutamyl-tRNA reductase [Chloroflexi bacterium]|nr:glutamyl-tRNA reductase [Chloroflexota bacterium]
MEQLVCAGVSYRTAPVTLRERLAFSPATQSQLLTQVATEGYPGLSELVILSTCNRVELYATGGDDELEQSLLEYLLEVWSASCGVGFVDLEPHVSIHREQEAARHLMAVSCGLDSQVIGEPQILGQVAEAYELARQCGAARTLLAPLFQRAIEVGKRARTDTTIGQGTLSIGSVAAAHSQHVLGEVPEATVLVIGTGDMAQAAASALVRRSVDRLLVTNHDAAHAEEFAAALGGVVVPYTQMSGALEKADLVISAVSAPHPILQLVDIRAVQERRRGRRLVIFDIALPRNVEPAVGSLEHVQLYNLDDLQEVTTAHYLARQEAVPVVVSLIDSEVAAFNRERATRAAVPVIQGLRSKADTLREQELAWLLRRLPTLDERSTRLIEEFSRRLVNKLLHTPTLKLKEKSADGEMSVYASVIDELFALELP